MLISGVAIGLVVVVGVVAGLLIGRKMAKQDEKQESRHLRSVTRFLAVTTQVCCLCWISLSYLIAIYSTIWLGQTYTMSELSEPALNGLCLNLVMKVISNIFEHNDGALFGSTRQDEGSDQY